MRNFFDKVAWNKMVNPKSWQAEDWDIVAFGYEADGGGNAIKDYAPKLPSPESFTSQSTHKSVA